MTPCRSWWGWGGSCTQSITQGSSRLGSGPEAGHRGAPGGPGTAGGWRRASSSAPSQEEEGEEKEEEEKREEEKEKEKEEEG